jgi:hypothetical protein
MEKEIRGIKSNRGNPASWVLLFSLTFSLLAFVVYLAEPGFSDETLFFLLAVLRYSSFLVFVCSVYLMIAGICRFIRWPSVMFFLGIFLYLLGALYGACIIIIDAFIISITGGIG